MKKFGLIGGVGPESSIDYYRLIIKRYRERLDTNDYPELVINSINMTEMLDYVFNNKLDELVDFLAERVKTLELSGVDFAAIASNTPHIVFDRLQAKVGIPLVSIVEEACKAVREKNLDRVALLGTKSTMTAGFYNRAAEKLGIKLVIPEPSDQDYIHEKYMGELVFNNVFPETKKQLIHIVNGLKEKEAIQGLILGGTELPLILAQSDFTDLEVFDTTKVHVESIVAGMLQS